MVHFLTHFRVTFHGSDQDSLPPAQGRRTDYNRHYNRRIPDDLIPHFPPGQEFIRVNLHTQILS